MYNAYVHTSYRLSVHNYYTVYSMYQGSSPHSVAQKLGPCAGSAEIPRLCVCRGGGGGGGEDVRVQGKESSIHIRNGDITFSFTFSVVHNPSDVDHVVSSNLIGQ